MQSVSETYKRLIKDRTHIKVVKAVINNTTYLQGQISGVKRSQKLMDGFSIGNANSAMISLDFEPLGVIPKAAEVDLYIKAKTQSEESEWIPKGVFFIAEREIDIESGLLSVVCYDAMRKADVVFLKTGTWTSQTALSIVRTIASHIGVNVESETVALMTATSYTIDTIPVMGDDGTTEREMLMYIAVMYGGNFVINDAGELALVGLTDIPDPTHYLVSEDGDCITFGGVRILV